MPDTLIIQIGVHTNAATDRKSLALKGGFNLIRTKHRNATATHVRTRKATAIATISGLRSSIDPIVFVLKKR